MTNAYNKNVERGEVKVWSHCMQFKFCCLSDVLCRPYSNENRTSVLENKTNNKKKATANKEWYIQ